jgi:hypothetical protein
MKQEAWVTAPRVDGLCGALGQTFAPMGLAALCEICVSVGGVGFPGIPVWSTSELFVQRTTKPMRGQGSPFDE